MSLVFANRGGPRSNFVGSLDPHATVSQVIELLGAPEDTGKGLRGFKILAYLNGQLQITFWRGSLNLVAFYFSPNDSAIRWPEVFTIPSSLTPPTS